MKNPDPIPEIGADLRINLKRWIKDADEDAAKALIEGLYPVVIRIIHNHLPRGTAPDDLAQDVFLQFFRTVGRYDDKRPLENWIARLALNVCLNALRSRKRRPEWRWSDFTESEQAAIDPHLVPHLTQRPTRFFENSSIHCPQKTGLSFNFFTLRKSRSPKFRL